MTTESSSAIAAGRARTPRSASGRARLMLLAAPTRAALTDEQAALAAALHAEPGQPLADVARALWSRRDHGSWRAAFACCSVAEALRILDGGPQNRLAVAEVGRPRLVLLFPGGGAHYAGMARELYGCAPELRRAVDECLTILRGLMGRSADDLPLFDAAAEAARDNLTSLVSVFVFEYALARQWLALAPAPDAMLGHSIGEYVAATLAGVFTLEDALAVVVERARLLDTLPPGAMTSVAAVPDDLAVLWTSELSIAALNGPRSTVVSGPLAAIERFEQRALERGHESRRMRVRAAGHSREVEPILGELGRVLARVRLAPPSMPWVSNVTGALIAPGQATDPRYWVEQLRRPVRFAQGLVELAAIGPTTFLEVGPGQVLASLAAPLVRGAHAVVAGGRDPRHDRSSVEQLMTAWGALWCRGHAVRTDHVLVSPEGR